MFAKIIELAQWSLANYQVVVADLSGVIASLIVFFAVIPGEHPEKELHAIADFVAKFSKK